MKNFMSGFADELIKMAFEGWGMSGTWGKEIDTPVSNQSSPLLHEQHVPADVEYKNMRRDYFHGRVMPQSSGKVPEGKLGVPRFASPKRD